MVTEIDKRTMEYFMYSKSLEKDSLEYENKTTVIQPKSGNTPLTLEGKVNYDATISINDMDARLIDLLGNEQKLMNAGATGGLQVNETFFVDINGDSEQRVYFQILSVEKNTFTGFTAAVIKNLSTNKNILWADGSKGFNNIFNNTGNDSFFNLITEYISDWLVNNILGIGSKIYEFCKNLLKVCTGIDKMATKNRTFSGFVNLN